jgi:hypothetical protein
MIAAVSLLQSCNQSRKFLLEAAVFASRDLSIHPSGTVMVQRFDPGKTMIRFNACTFADEKHQAETLEVFKDNMVNKS